MKVSACTAVWFIAYHQASGGVASVVSSSLAPPSLLRFVSAAQPYLISCSTSHAYLHQPADINNGHHIGLSLGSTRTLQYDKAAKKRIMPELENSIMLTSISDVTVPCFRPSRDIAIPMLIDNHKFNVDTLIKARDEREEATRAKGAEADMLAKDEDYMLERAEAAMDAAGATQGGIDGRNIFAFFWGSFHWFDYDADYRCVERELNVKLKSYLRMVLGTEMKPNESDVVRIRHAMTMSLGDIE